MSGPDVGRKRRRAHDELDAASASAAGARIGAGPPIGEPAGEAAVELTRLALSSPTFTTMRTEGAIMVDKTGAIVDMLNCHAKADVHRVFFARPRKFGKSLTITTSAAILAAGDLPGGVDPWPGYARVDIDAVFGGTEAQVRVRVRVS